MVCHGMACSSIWIIHQSRRFVCLLNLSLLHLRRSLAISAGTKIDKLQTVLGTIQHEYHDNLCVHAHCMHCFNKRHIVCILFLPLFGTGACKCLEPSRVISIISNCIVSSHVSCPTSPCLNVLACSSFHFVAITILIHFLSLVVLCSSFGTKFRNPINARTRPLLDQTAPHLGTPDLVQLPLASGNCAHPRLLLQKCNTQGMRRARAIATSAAAPHLTALRPPMYVRARPP